MGAILLCVDLKKNNKGLVKAAINLATKQSKNIFIINVKKECIKSSKYVTGLKEFPNQAKNLYKENYQLSCIIQQIKDEGINCGHLSCYGEISQEIIKKAMNSEIDIIVMGAEQNSSVKHLITGSIPGKVMKKIKKPVMLIPLLNNNYENNELMYGS